MFLEKKGPLPTAQELSVVDVVEFATPANWVSRIPRGSKNIFLIFRKPGDPQEYAVPVGEVEGATRRFAWMIFCTMTTRTSYTAIGQGMYGKPLTSTR